MTSIKIISCGTAPNTCCRLFLELSLLYSRGFWFHVHGTGLSLTDFKFGRSIQSMVLRSICCWQLWHCHLHCTPRINARKIKLKCRHQHGQSFVTYRLSLLHCPFTWASCGFGINSSDDVYSSNCWGCSWGQDTYFVSRIESVQIRSSAHFLDM